MRSCQCFWRGLDTFWSVLCPNCPAPPASTVRLILGVSDVFGTCSSSMDRVELSIRRKSEYPYSPRVVTQNHLPNTTRKERHHDLRVQDRGAFHEHIGRG